MKELHTAISLLVLLMLPGCGVKSAAGPENAATVDCAIEIQIAVRNFPLKPDDNINDGDMRVAGACVLPVHSTGGPGCVVSNTDGTIIQIEWNDVRMIGDGNHIEFAGFDWEIANRIVRRDGISHTFSGSDAKSELLHKSTTRFGTEFVPLGSVELDTASEQKTGRRLVIRGRLLPKAPPARPLKLEDAIANSF